MQKNPVITAWVKHWEAVTAISVELQKLGKDAQIHMFNSIQRVLTTALE